MGARLAQKLFLLRTPAVVVAVRIGLTFFPYRRIAGWIPKPRAGRAGPGPHRIAWAVTRTARFVPRATCLTQALSAQALLAWAGRPSQIKIGVAPETDGRFAAHAWVVSEGRVIIGGSARELQRYTSIADLNPSAP